MSAHCTLIIEFDDFDVSQLAAILAAAQPVDDTDTDDGEVISEAAPAVAEPAPVVTPDWQV